MNKEEFIRELQDSLDMFLTEQREAEIDIFLKKIDELKITKHLSEEEIIKSFGAIDEIKKEILKKHGIDYKKIGSKKSFLYQKFEELFSVIHKIVNVMSKNTLKENSKIIVDLLVLILVIIILKIPFILVRNLGDSLFQVFDTQFLLELWGFMIDLIYIVVAVMVFANIVTKWFKNVLTTKKKQLKIKSLDSITLKEK